MFDMGFLELLLIGVIGLIVLGPERLPVAARTAGRWLGKAKRMVSQFSSEIDKQLEVDELRTQLKEQGENLDINEGIQKIHETANAVLKDVKQVNKNVFLAKATQPISTLKKAINE